MKVFKFGGASVKDAASVRNMCTIINSYHTENELIVIISAMGKTTNALEELLTLVTKNTETLSELEALKTFHLEIVKDLFKNKEAAIYKILDKLFFQLEEALKLECDSKMKYDQVVSFGELLSTNIIAEYLNEINVSSQWIDARNYIQTNNSWKEASVDWKFTESIMRSELQTILSQKVIITQGFIGGTLGNKTTTLGREGSDFSAAVFASCLNAESVTTWKDVAGILNADPKKISETSLFEQLDYKDAAEMTYYGASVIHPKTIRPLAVKNIPLFVKSFKNPKAKGTCIHNFEDSTHNPALIFKPKQAIIHLEVKDFSNVNRYNLSKVFNILEHLKIKVNLMSNSAISVTICCNSEEKKFTSLQNQLKDEFYMEIKKDLELITIKEFDTTSVAEFQSEENLWEQKIDTIFHIVREVK